jgi:hypothetical protein
MTFQKRYCCLLLAGLVFLGACGDQRNTFRLMAPAQPFDAEIATELAAVLEHNSRHRIEIVPLPDGFETPLEALEAGYADLAFTSNTQPYRQGITTVMPIYPTVLHILYREIMDSLDVEESEVTFVDKPATLPDVNLVYVPISPERIRGLLKQDGVAGQYTFLSFGSPEDVGSGGAIDRAVLLNPRVTPFIIPVGTYGDLPEQPVLTLAVDKLLVSRPDLDSAVVYDLINEIRRLQPALAAKRPFLFQELGAEFDASGSTFVLHPGSQAFAVRDEPTFYERYSGVAEVLVTLVIGLISGAYAVIQIYNRRRKNRIDGFYTDVMEIRDSVNERSSSVDRAAAVERVRALQNEAFGMLINEKLAADESFRIFVTLSNDIIAQLK